MMERADHVTMNNAHEGLDGNALKLIALTSMFIDHIGAVVLYYMGSYRGELRFISPLLSHDWGQGLYYIYMGCRMVGRLAFPVYCFLLTEGFIHTRDWRTYCLRLGVFALIAEIPFDLAINNQFTWGAQNVFWELTVGLLTLQGIKAAEGYFDFRRGIYMTLAVGAGCAVAWAMRADYGAYGILLIAACYLLRDRKAPRLLLCGAMSFLSSLRITWGAAALAFLPLYFYSGSRGKQRNRYMFYWFYPVHLLLLFGFRQLVLGIPLYLHFSRNIVQLGG